MGSRLQGDRDAQIRRSREWQSRPALSRAVRAGVFAVPVAACLGVAALLSHVLPPAGSVATTALWTAVIGSASLVTLVMFQRAARSFLRLAALLDLSLIFPGAAPARFAVARRAGRPGDLEAQLSEAHAAGDDDEDRRLQTVAELALALSIRDGASRGHSARVREFTDLLADELKIPAASRNHLRWAALLHDIGRVEVPPGIVDRPGKPGEAEGLALQRHPEDGARLVAALLPWLGEWGHAVAQHHERFDGTGHPRQLKGQDIALAARIVSVADAYDVMIAPRADTRPMSAGAARRELVRVAGTQLDPAIVRAFLTIPVGRLRRAAGLGVWIAQGAQLARIPGVGGWSGSGLGMGIVTAATATVLAATGIIGPGQTQPALSPTGLARAVAVAPSHAPEPQPEPPRATAPPRRDTATARPASTAAPIASTTPTAQAQPTATAPAATTPTPSPGPTPTTTPKPTPTPVATPKPTPDPWSCAQCTNGSAGCTSYCSNSKACITYCQGTNTQSCTSHCFGTSNAQCTTYCQGSNDAKCKSLCRNAAVVAVAVVTSPAPASGRPEGLASPVLSPLPLMRSSTAGS